MAAGVLIFGIQPLANDLQLDRRDEFLVEAGEGKDLPLAEKPFPAQIDIVDTGGLQLRVALDDAIPKEVVVLVGRKLAHLRSRERHGIGRPQEHVTGQPVLERNAGQVVDIGSLAAVRSKALRGVLLGEGALRLHLLRVDLDASPACHRQRAHDGGL